MSANPAAMNLKMRMKKVDHDHEILGRRAALRATVALELGYATPLKLRMLGSGTHEDLHHMGIFSALQR